jgi:hypothetical protein
MALMNRTAASYRQFHKSLRLEINETPQKFQKRYRHQTPAMKMGLTTTQLTWRDLILAPIWAKGSEAVTECKIEHSF